MVSGVWTSSNQCNKNDVRDSYAASAAAALALLGAQEAVNREHLFRANGLHFLHHLCLLLATNSELIHSVSMAGLWPLISDKLGALVIFLTK